MFCTVAAAVAVAASGTVVGFFLGMNLQSFVGAPGKTQPQTQSQQKKLTSATRMKTSWDNTTGPYTPSLDNTTGPYTPSNDTNSLDNGDDECSVPCSKGWFPCPSCPAQTGSQVCADHGTECAGERDTCGQTCEPFEGHQCHWEAQCCAIGKYCGSPGKCCQASDECVDFSASNSVKVGKKCCMEEVEMRDLRKCISYAWLDDDWFGFQGTVDCTCSLFACDCTKSRFGSPAMQLSCEGRIVFPPGDESVEPSVQVQCQARCCDDPTVDDNWCQVFDCELP
jgi:hypothetical protein